MGNANSHNKRAVHKIFLNGSLFHNCEGILTLFLEAFVIVMDGILYQKDLSSLIL